MVSERIVYVSNKAYLTIRVSKPCRKPFAIKVNTFFHRTRRRHHRWRQCRRFTP